MFFFTVSPHLQEMRCKEIPTSSHKMDTSLYLHGLFSALFPGKTVRSMKDDIWFDAISDTGMHWAEQNDRRLTAK